MVGMIRTVSIVSMVTSVVTYPRAGAAVHVDVRAVGRAVAGGPGRASRDCHRRAQGVARQRHPDLQYPRVVASRHGRLPIQGYKYEMYDFGFVF